MIKKIFPYLSILLLALLCIFLAVFVPGFFTIRNFINIFKQSSALSLMAIGMSIVLIGGGIDLSIPATMALSGILGAMYMRGGGNPIIAVLIMLAVGICIGMINGYAISYLKMIPFVVTLSMMYIATGASTWLTKEVSIYGLSSSYINVLLSKVWFIPLSVLILLLITAFITVMTRRSVFGKWLYAVGIDPESSRYMGIPKHQIIFATYAFSGLFAGIAAVIIVARLMSASATMGNIDIVLNVIGAAVIGGVSIYGGVGSPLGAVIGALIITIIGNVMNLMNMSYYTTLIVRGSIIVVIIALDSFRCRLSI